MTDWSEARALHRSSQKVKGRVHAATRRRKGRVSREARRKHANVPNDRSDGLGPKWMASGGEAGGLPLAHVGFEARNCVVRSCCAVCGKRRGVGQRIRRSTERRRIPAQSPDAANWTNRAPAVDIPFTALTCSCEPDDEGPPRRGLRWTVSHANDVFDWRLRLVLRACFAGFGRGEASAADQPDLAELSIEQLAQLPVRSASKREEPLSSAPAALVRDHRRRHRDVGRDDRLPEALRLAPNLQVQQVDASNYSISARGFNGVAGRQQAARR